MLTVQIRELAVMTWPAFLSASDCERALSMFSLSMPHEKGVIFRDASLASALSFLVPPDAPSMRLMDAVTFGSPSPDGGDWHKDSPLGARWKLCAYLTEIGGIGTEFESGYAPPTPVGTVVIFDTELSHRSHPYDRKYTKRVVGLRGVDLLK